MGLFSGEHPEELTRVYNEIGISEVMVQEGLRSIYSQLTVVSSEHVGDEFHFKLRIPMPKIEMPDISEMPELQGMELPEGMDLSEMPDHLEMPDMTYKMRKEADEWRIYDIDF